MMGKFMVKEGEDQDWNLGKSELYENAIYKKLVMLVEHHYREGIYLMDLNLLNQGTHEAWKARVIKEI